MKTVISKAIDLLLDEAQYPCHFKECREYVDGDGCRAVYPADMLYWHKDGFYCEFCIDHRLLISVARRGRSLRRELQLKAERGTCHRRLPNPEYFPCADARCEQVWTADWMHWDSKLHGFVCQPHKMDRHPSLGETLTDYMKENC